MSSDHDDTVVMPAGCADAPPPPRPPPVRVEFGALTHPGKVRPHNEDHFLVARLSRRFEALLTNLPGGDLPDHFGEASYAMLVADGVGGSAGGEVASRLAIISLVNAVVDTPDWVMRVDEQRAQEVMRRGAAHLRQAHAVLAGRAAAESGLAGMSTTMTVAYSLGWDLFLGHIGDSRAYLFRGGQLRRLTRDHTVAQALADAGEIPAEEVATHRLRHMLTNVLGGRAASPAGDVFRQGLAAGDVVLLCSDGLTEMAREADIAGVLARGGPPQETCQALVDLALAGGGKDNVTVILARYEAPEGPPAGPS
jgi:protein phosphatase